VNGLIFWQAFSTVIIRLDRMIYLSSAAYRRAGLDTKDKDWIPAFAGMTSVRRLRGGARKSGRCAPGKAWARRCNMSS